MLASQDIDPLYPVLRRLYDLYGMPAEERLWFSALYVAFYNLPSALAAWIWIAGRDLDGCADHLAKLPTGIERRGMRGGAVVPYLWRMLEHEPLGAWLTRGWKIDRPRGNYEVFWERWQTVPGNGRWSAFKMGEILRRVHDFDLLAPDMRMEFCSGPKEGLQWLYDTKSNEVSLLNTYGQRLRMELASRGVHLDWEHLETILCNFNSARKGKYYVGHDIDELQEQISSHKYLFDGEKQMLWKARSDVLSHEYLGECQGWHGVQKHRMKEWA